jgi:uncharacterized protein
MMDQVLHRPARERISLEAARRIALAAQGFADARPSGGVDAGDVRRVIDRVGVLQVDSVNVVCRSHYLPVFARLGPYPRTMLDGMAWDAQGRELFEYFWGQKAALVPLTTYPLLRWRMQAAAEQVWDRQIKLHPNVQVPWAVVAGMWRLTSDRPGLVDEVLALVAERGPVGGGDASPDGRRRSKGDPDPDPSTGKMWNWQDPKIAVEWLLCSGKVSIAARRNFERLYDLTERVIPAQVLGAPVPGVAAAQRELIRIAARAQGVATAGELCAPGRGYISLPRGSAKERIAELVEAGELLPVRVEGIRQPMYRSPEAQEPAHVRARALLSPFDSLIWARDRTQRLFGFHYRTSIYTPEAQRAHGYYVLPFLLGERIVARVDVKADRRNATLQVPVVHIEPEQREHEREIAAELAAELRSMAHWLELDRVTVLGRGDLAPALSRAVNAGR